MSIFIFSRFNLFAIIQSSKPKTFWMAKIPDRCDRPKFMANNRRSLRFWHALTAVRLIPLFVRPVPINDWTTFRGAWPNAKSTKIIAFNGRGQQENNHHRFVEAIPFGRGFGSNWEEWIVQSKKWKLNFKNLCKFFRNQQMSFGKDFRKAPNWIDFKMFPYFCFDSIPAESTIQAVMWRIWLFPSWPLQTKWSVESRPGNFVNYGFFAGAHKLRKSIVEFHWNQWIGLAQFYV